ncbi:MAG TPA: ATP-binding protein [Chitinophagaceae bacterium]|nr:ATP-binding protein [Chitinophagaceae bacterium]
MATSVKNKIRLGTLFLFLLLLLSGGMGIYNLVRLKNDAKMILEDNYESLDYCHIMQRQLDSFNIDRPDALRNFEDALRKQENNVTEPGEYNATAALRSDFDKLKKGDSSTPVIRDMHKQLHFILNANMNAIERKNSRTETKAENALTLISVIAAVIFLVAFTFSFNFPSVLTDPIRKLTEAIQEISRKNYKYRIHIKNKDEFGQMADAFNAMAERLEYFESSNLNKLMFEKSRVEAVINSLKDASIGVDKNSIILFANNQALQLLGLEAKDIVGRPASEVAERNDLFRFLLNEKNNIPFKIVVDGKENYFTKEIIEVQQEGSRNTVIVVRNITSFKELDVAKTNFIATISHELKTPLASSDFSLKLLEDGRNGKLTKDQKDLVHQLKLDNQRMLRILSELLNMSQVEAGKIQLEIRPVKPASIANNAINTTSAAAKEKEIHFERNYDEELPSVRADAEKTGWVLNNFLSNAIKYSSAGSKISVNIKLVDGSIQFSVKDQGTGIPGEYLPKIFERFFKVPGASKTGTGLGLAISKEFIEAEGGKIWVKSTNGEGSEFGFDLPVVS